MTAATTIPERATDIDAAWLTAALRSVGKLEPDVTVTAVAVEPIGTVVGVFGTVHRVRPTYSATTAAPPTMVAKFPTDMADNKAVGMTLNFYDKEIRVIRDVLPDTPVDAAQLVYAAVDAEAGRYALLIDEVVDRTVGDQVVGCTPAQGHTVMRALAKLHARWWDDDALSAEPWMWRADHPVQMAVVPAIMQAAMPAIAATKSHVVSAEAIALGERITAQFPSIIERCAAGSRTLNHTDTRAVNLFFDDAADNVTFIDWQLCIWASPMQDVQYFCSSSITGEVWDEHGDAFLRTYLDALVACGVSDYSWDQLWSDFVLHSAAALVYPGSTVGTFDMGNEYGRQLADAWLARTFELAVKVDAGSVLT
jgi:hypothetical protein